jgi:hypothetical protein
MALKAFKSQIDEISLGTCERFVRNFRPKLINKIDPQVTRAAGPPGCGVSATR